MKKLVMKRAWELYKKGFSEIFRQCLKASWELTKKQNTYFQDEQATVEELDSLMRNNRNFRHQANEDNLSPSLKYNGKGNISYENLKLWVVKGRARVYVDKKIDGIKVEQNYIQYKI